MKTGLASLLCALLLPLAAQATARFALLVGNNEGAPGRPRLAYAVRDARQFASVLVEVGDFPKDQVVVIENGRVADVNRALAQLESRIADAQKAGESGLLLFYFSGHANAHAMELGEDSLGFDELRTALEKSQSAAWIGVVDACGAGELTRAKGGKASAGIDFAFPPQEDVKGVAFLAAASMGEQAQESTILRGSFFTSSLEEALRGAADLDGDGRVTLTEAFFYTSARTTEATMKTTAGAQHPTYQTNLSGRGEVVMSDLRKAEARLTLPPAPGAVWIIRGPSFLLSEVPGSTKPMSLAIGAATYTIERVEGDYFQTTEVTLARGDDKTLPPLSSRRLVSGANKGGYGLNEMALGVSFNSGVMLNSNGGWGGSFSYARSAGPVRLRVKFEGGMQSVSDQGLNYGLSNIGGAAALLVPLVWMPARLEVGAQGGGDWMYQKLQSGRTLQAAGGHGEALLMLSYPVGPIRIGTEFAAGVERFPVNNMFTNQFFATGSLLAGTEF